MITRVQFPKVQQDFYPLQGGLDLVTPAIELSPGMLIDCQNYEPAIGGGYRRIDGYERYDGRPSPSAQSYWILGVNFVSKPAVGTTFIGATSGATGIVLALDAADMVVGSLIGNFAVGENLQIGGTTFATVTALQTQNGSVASGTHCNNLLLAANWQRNQIGQVPGSGPITGVWVYNGNVVAFRNNAAGTANLMYEATASGWQQVNFGNEIHVSTLNVPTGTVTFSSGSPTTVSWNAHGLVANQAVQFSSTANLPVGIQAGLTYYVTTVTANTFQLATAIGGAAVNTISTGTGTITCTVWGNTMTAGMTVTGKTSGATATVGAALLMTGTWTTALVGTLVLANVTGTFQSGEALMSTGVMLANAASAATQIVRQPCTSMCFSTYNFAGATGQNKLYGADGVNTAFEFDGTNYAPIHTGMAADAPVNVLGYEGYLWLSFGASVQYSGLGLPYSWSVVLGAGQFNTSDAVTGFLPQKGTIYGNALAIFTKYRTFILYGQTNQNFDLVPSIYDVGISQSTMQMVSNDGYGFTTRGIQSLITTLNYGNFDYVSVSHTIQPMITLKTGMECASTTLRAKNQYRVYFTDGTAIAVGLTGDKIDGMTLLNYQLPVTCICTTTLSNGQEVTYFGSNTGYVYQDNVGTSQDGNAIEAWIRLPFNNEKSPRYRKRWRRAVFDMSVVNYAQVNIGYDLGYGNPNVQPSAPVADTSVSGGGGYWDQFTWDNFTWDIQVVNNQTLTLGGTEKNISFLVYSKYAQFQSHTIQGVTLVYSVRLLERS